MSEQPDYSIDAVRLKILIRSAGYRIVDVCKKLSLSKSGFYKKLSGKSEFTCEEIRKMGEILGKSNSLDYFSCFFHELSKL